MISLKKPVVCLCGSADLYRKFKPERWICEKCNNIVVVRQSKPDSDICRDCGRTRDEVAFKKNRRVCIDCYNLYRRRWYKASGRKYYNQPDVKKRLQHNVHQTIEKSPESFIKYKLMHIMKKRNGYGGENQIKRGSLNAVCLNINITYEYLIDLWRKQRGLCAISNIPLAHILNDMCSISIDRIDSNRGYLIGNVQFVCKWVNYAKRNNTDREFIKVIHLVVKHNMDNSK